MKIFHFARMKANQEKISMVTCYDYTSALIVADSAIDCVLVGDSSAMVMHGHRDTIPATIDMLTPHVEAVAKGAGEKFIIADLPFLSYRQGIPQAVAAVQRVIQAGAHAVKLEGVQGNEAVISHLVESGIPVMGHLGLSIQAIHQVGGFRVQGKTQAQAKQIFEDAQRLQALGCFSVVLECIPAPVAQQVSEALTIPTIGIGAGNATDGQVLVLQDLLGMQKDFQPKFVKQYMNGYQLIQQALNQYAAEVKSHAFPSVEYTYPVEVDA